MRAVLLGPIDSNDDRCLARPDQVAELGPSQLFAKHRVGRLGSFRRPPDGRTDIKSASLALGYARFAALLADDPSAEFGALFVFHGRLVAQGHTFQLHHLHHYAVRQLSHLLDTVERNGLRRRLIEKHGVGRILRMAGHATLLDDLHDLVVADTARGRRRQVAMVRDGQQPEAGQDPASSDSSPQFRECLQRLPPQRRG